MLAPNILRVGTDEKVFVEVQDYSGNDLQVTISIKNYRHKMTELTSATTTLTAANNFQSLVNIKIPDNKGFFSNDPLEKHYVYLQAQFPSSLLEKVVLVSFQSGYIFVQTDKNIYTPETTVLPSFQVALNPSKPFFYMDDEVLEVEITAKYLFGENVDGVAFVVFEVRKDDKRITLPRSLSRTLVYVTNPDQSPAENVGVVIRAGQEGEVRSLTRRNGFAKVTVNTNKRWSSLDITAKTKVPDISAKRQAENKMIAEAYATKGGSGNYLHIRADNAGLAINDETKFQLIVQSSVQDQDLTYLILSKGQIVKAERLKRKELISLSERITKDLVPSFRLVAYYHIGSEVVSDSIWVDVKDTCMGTLKLDVKQSLNGQILFNPGEEFDLVVTGDPSAKVGLVAVDKGVFALNKNRLTQSKIWNLIEKYDTGCTAGSGNDSMGVFYDAGLLFQSDIAGGTKERTGQKVSQTIEQVISGDFMGRLIRKPIGSGDQLMVSMTLSLTATHYLDTTNQWEAVGLDRRNEAIQHITTGYAEELNFRKEDGSYAPFLSRSSSTWLTAYVVKVFAMASDYISIDKNVLCSAIKWLILNAQMADGTFKKSSQVFYSDMVNFPGSSSKALDYLEGRLPFLTNPYAIAMTSYALANAGKFNKDRLLQASSEDGSNWQVPGGQFFSVEATAYALLALVKAKEFDAAGKVVRWLNRQRINYGGHGTTQVQLQQEFNVTAKGTGAGVLKVMNIYYAKPIEKKIECKSYTVSVELKKEAKTSYKDAEESYMLTINVLYNNPNRDATMTILDIGLLTGFVVDKRDLAELSSGNDKYIQKFEMDKELSERGSLIIYLDKVSHSVPDRIAFRMHKMNKVDMLQPAAVSVYEYYSPVYKVKVVETNLNLNTDFYEMEIEEILREGIDRIEPGNQRTFMGHADCRSAFNFVKGKSYLLMGQRSNLLKEDNKNVMLAPNILHMDTDEKVFVEAQDYSGNDLQVTISIKDYPHKMIELTSATTTLTAANNFQSLVNIKIPDGMKGFFSDDPLKKQYVYLQAQFPSSLLEKVVLVSFQSGFIFVQTDKSIYKPETTVLPNFEVALNPSKPFFYMDDEKLEVEITAKYLFGKNVEGVAFVVFEVRKDDRRIVLPRSLSRTPITNGVGHAVLTRSMIQQSINNIDDLVGGSLFISASVLTQTGSEMVKAEKEDIQIVKSPYTIEFKKTPKYFHPGMPFDVTVYVTNPDQSPAENVGVVIRAGQEGEVRSLTRRNGFAKVTVNTNERWSSLDITILSKGQIVKAERLKKKEQMILSERITKDLVPSFRLVAYYHIGSEIVSDSIRVELKLNVKQMSKKVFQTGENFNLVVTGDPSAKVGLVAVDKRVFLLNKDRLTQSKIWNLIEKYDTGCTAGSGKDSMGVFYDAGLLFQSDKAGGTKERTVGKFAKDLKKCCADGIRQTRLDYTCEKRSTFIMEDSECVKAFLDCCTEIGSHKDKQRPLVRLARSQEYDYDDDFFPRTQFPESWFWEDISLPACPGNKPCTTTTLTMDTNYLKDSITTWQILAISLSKTHGICVADPYEITVVKDFFVDLKLPYSAIHKEQVEIKAILYNFSNMRQRVRLEFFETEQFCSIANKKKYRSIVNIDPESSRSVSFLIIPIKIGDHHIEVKAASGSYHDGVRKTLKIIPEGMLTEILETKLELNPSQFFGGIQTVQMKTDILSGQVPNTPAHSQIIVTGQQVSQIIEQVISGDFMGRLIVKPIGSGDQLMISMTLPLIATHYLDTTNQWEAVGLHKRNEAIQHIKTGYLQELKFRKDDGSYASFLTRPSSTWLTAYVVKVFAMANDYISIDKNVLCSAIKWLILNAQMPDGTFKERSPVVHSEMVGDVRGKDSDASLTAFVLIALQEGNHHCATYVSSILESSSKALNYLERRLLSLNNPYAIAMTSYALAKAGKFNKDHLLQASSEDGSYWQVPGGQFFSVEATAYALLALVKAKEFNAAGKAVRWLNRQRINYGGHGTTQATIMVFQAVAEYYKQVSHQKNVDLMVEVRVQLQQEFNVTAKGTGAGVFKVMTIYYARPIEKKSNCKNYTVSLEMKREAITSYSNAEESYMFTINVLYNDPNGDAPMTILDIGLLTGFVVDKRDLTELSSGNDKYIQKFEMNEELSERGSLIIYLDKVSHSVPDRIAFRMHKLSKVIKLQPAAVSVYEYYSPEERCVKFYHPTKKEGALSMLCSNREGLCECAEVYKAKVVAINLNPNTDFYEMEIEEILREDEKVFVEAQDYSGNDLQVTISIMNYPQKSCQVAFATTTLTAANNFQSLVNINIRAFCGGPLEKQYVYLQAQFPTGLLEKVVLVSPLTGYIFVQTDKSIYTPGTTVSYRIFLLNLELKPDDRAELDVDIIVIDRQTMRSNKGFVIGQYRIPELVKFGTWSIAAQYKNNPQKNFTAEFETKDYVLPSFEVAFKLPKPFFYVEDETFEVEIIAKYLFGKNVDGVAFVVFGVRKDKLKIRLTGSLSRETITNGVGRAVLTKTKIQQAIPNINDLEGGSLFISVSVLTQTGSEMVEAEKGGIQIVKSPYTIEFKKTPKYFHPGMSFDVAVYVTNPDQSPAENVDVVIKVGQDQREVKGRTKSNGIAKVIVNTQAGWNTVDITARTDVPGISAERQAQNKMIAEAYTTKEGSGNYLHISADSAELQINDDSKFLLNFKSNDQDQDLTYLILSKGQIVKAERFNRKGQSIISLSERITKDLVPSFRLVAYYHVGAEVVSDSIWVDVKDTCMGTLKLSVKDNPDGKIYEPGDEFELVVTGDPSAKVGLVAVDKGVFALNKNRLTQSKIWNLIEKYDKGCTAGSGKDSMGVFYDAGLLFQSDKAGGTKERTGICVADPFEITVAKEFFVDLKLPYSAVHNEQVEIKAILYNFSKKRQMVRVEFFETENICSTASKKEKYRTIVNVDPNSSRSVPFVFIPMKIGEHHIEVQAASSSYHDGVRRTLKVVSEGVLTEQLEANMELNPSQAPGGVQVVQLTSEVPSGQVPNTDAHTYITVVGQKFSQTIKQAISGDFMGRLIVQPTGSGEQNMIYMTLPLIATHYLDTTEQWEGVGLGRRYEAIQHITTGYVRELTYRKPDGSYAALLNRPSSTWLTAYVAKVFAMASDLIHLEKNVICSAIKWLTLNVQMPDGMFIEKAPVVQSEMVHLLESSNKALSFLERRLPFLTNPYAIAMTSYALANAGKFNKDLLLQASSEGGSYWQVPGGQFFSVEATAYALLALVKAQEFDAAGKAVRWLNRQSINYGGHGTTQATIMVFQAVAEYYKQVSHQKKLDLMVEVSELVLQFSDYKDPYRDATMTILDIGLLTGFVVDKSDRTDLNSGNNKYIQMTSELSERGSLIIYFDKVSHTVPEIIAFSVHKINKVDMLQPAAVSVYEHNSPGERCVKFYHPTKKEGALRRLCSNQGGLCECAEENCSIQKKQYIKDSERELKACDSDISYVYKVKVVEMNLNPNTDFYILEIEQILREGIDRVEPGNQRTFMGHADCRSAFNFVKGKSYLLMGQLSNLLKEDNKLLYILGEKTWIEYWPTSVEGQTNEYKEKYQGITALAEVLSIVGCFKT
ncbi:complement component c3a precursor [Silurus asotus]|uniref:Complement component c3a n=1 Tax=Silurus asotus TaxID=30991 RepID=A0AAD5FPI2_SILAS|nr:complement component c3a precursor [Silurus asotus]